MKKFFITLFFFLILTSAQSSPIEIKQGEENSLYNFRAKNFNNFYRDVYLETTKSNCQNIPTSTTFAVDFVDCMYLYIKQKFNVHEINITQNIVETYHNWYLTIRRSAQAYTNKLALGNVTDQDIINFDTQFKESLKQAGEDAKRFWIVEAEIAQKTFNADLRKKPKDSGPKIKDNEIIPASSGTGFFVNKNGHIVTNHHVIDSCSDIKIFRNGKSFQSKVIAVDKVNDLAIIKSDFKSRNYYSISNEDPELLQDVIVAGFPLGKRVSESIKTSKGSITALAGYGDNYSEFQTDAALNSGNSGGPIMSNDGAVVGVAVAAFGKKEGVESFNFGIKASILKNFATANKIKLNTPSYFGNIKLGKLINEATVYIECWMTGSDLKRILADKDNLKAFYTKFKN